MLNTGFISFITKTGGGFDANGNPLPVIDTNSDYLPCALMVNTKEFKTLVDGQWLDSKYQMLIDNYLISDLDLSDLTEVQLQDSQASDLGKFQVQNKEPLPFTNRLKIVV